MSKKQKVYKINEIKLTKEEIKKQKEFESLTDKELEDLSDTVYQLSTIIFDYYANK